MRRLIVTAVLAGGLITDLTACQPSGDNAGAARSAAASVTADPAVAAELIQARALVKACFPAKPTAQIRTVHLVFLSSAAGKHGPEVVAAREKLLNCLGVPRARQNSFKNDAITAAEQQHPKILSLHPAAGVRAYLTVTLPQLVLKYKGVPASPAAPASASASAS